MLHRIVRLAGIDYRRYTPVNFVTLRRARIMRDASVRLVLDVGAHDGGYGREIRQYGYQGAIFSFEPLSAPYQQLEQAAREDGRWRTQRLGIGSAPGETLIHVSNHPTSSSLLKMTQAHEQACPGSEVVRTEQIRIERLDKLMDPAECKGTAAWLKIDVQGYEKHVLEGAGSLLASFSAIEVELSLACLYEGAPLIEEMMVYLRQRGFRPVSLEDAFVDRHTAHLMQVNGIFLRKD